MEGSKRYRLIFQLVQALIRAMENRDSYTVNHQNMVSRIARILAQELKLSSHEIEGVRVAGQIHDIGKIAIPASILSKPGKLHAEEFSLIKTHVQRGLEIVEGIDFPWPILTLIAQHHERLDGSGYPNALSGDSISFGARIISLADMVNAVTQARPYRKALGLEEAISFLRSDDGAGYDSDVVAAFNALVGRKDERFMECL